MAKKVDNKLKMIKTIDQALKLDKGNNEKTLKQITGLVAGEKNRKTEIAMIAAASKALALKEKTNLSDREIIAQIIPELNKILENID